METQILCEITKIFIEDILSVVVIRNNAIIFYQSFSLSDCNGTHTYNHLGCRFESRCSNFNFRYRACFEQGVPRHLGNYRVWIHSETRT